MAALKIPPHLPMTEDMNLTGKYTAHQRVLGFSRRTIERRRWSLGLWESYLAAHGATVATATVEHLEGFLTRWPSAQSRYSIRSDIHQFYLWAGERRHISGDDPTDRLPAIKIRRRAATPIAIDDVRRLLALAPRRVDRLMIMLAAYAGLRISEISALRGEDVDLAGRQLVVRSGKGGNDEVVPLADELGAELDHWPRHGRLVAISGQSVGDRIRTLLRRAGIAGRPHDLRHSFGTQAARRSGGNLVLVAQLMRHAQVATTQRYVRWHTTGHEIVTGLYDDVA